MLIGNHKRLCSVKSSQNGFTLLELIAVITIITILYGVFFSRISFTIPGGEENEIRKFANLCQFLHHEAVAQSENYRLIIDISENKYYVRREIPLDTDSIVQVDYLKNLRTKGEKERRRKEELEASLDLEKEFEEEDRRRGEALDDLFFQFVYGSRSGDVQLGTPLQFPNLANEVTLPDDIRFRDVKTWADTFDKGEVFIRFSGKGASDFAVVHFEIREHVYTVFLNPSTGSVRVEPKEIDLEWTYGKKS